MINRSNLKMALAAKPECLSLEQLERLAADPAQKNDHLDSCPRCQAELAMLKEFEANTPLTGEGASVAWISTELERRLEIVKNPRLAKQQTTSVNWLTRLFSVRWLVPISAAVVMAAVAVILLRSTKEPELRAESGNGPVIYRSQEVEVVAPIGELHEAPKNLQWKAFSGATTYNVSIMEVDHAPLWSGSTRDISVTIPAPTRSKMLPGKPVLWQVIALDAQGRTLAMSQIEHFSVARKSSLSNSGSLPH